ncbi:caspase family protein [Capilliphycus salinus ALCB114379]|uniref:caspase family protein n=1 Tax=Capilliphycus salinus TaxID=2768948 RepID=UPI0039A53D94
MTNSTPNFYALLIGIDFYFPHRLPEGYYYKNLRGCVRDINHVETYLTETFNLTPEQIIKLTATASDNPTQPKEPPELLPTYENMVAKFQELTAKAQPQDQVYIHYSGHGGRAKTIFEDIKGSGGNDEALVPCDIGQQNSQYLRDIEFAKLLEEMVNKELVITLVLDSCHSGGATREMSGDDRIRGEGFIDKTPRPTNSLVAPLEELAQNWQNSTGNNSRNMTVVNGLLPEPKGYTLIAACRDNEFAYEDVFEGTERNGALTYFLLKSLRDFGKEIAVEELFNRISNFVHNKFDRQTPMLMGEIERTFFGGKAVTANRNTAVMDVDLTKNRVKLQMGEASGIKKGVCFDVFKFGTRNFQDSQNKIATVKVVEVGASDCWAEPTELHNEFIRREPIPKLEERMIEIGSPAVCLSLDVKQVRVLLPDSLPKFPDIDLLSLPTQIKEIKDTMRNNRYWIEFCSPEEPDENVDYFVSLNSEGEYWILDANKEPIKQILFPINIDDAKSSEKLINRLIHMTIYQNYLNIDNEDAFSRLNGKLKVELVKSVKRQPVVLNTDDKVPELKVDEENITFHIHNQSTNQTLNITALLFAEDFSITKIYPKGANYEVVEPGQEIIEDLKLSLEKNYEEGVNVIKVFANVYATNYHLLELLPLDGDLNLKKAEIVTKASNEWTTEKVEFVLKNI